MDHKWKCVIQAQRASFSRWVIDSSQGKLNLTHLLSAGSTFRQERTVFSWIWENSRKGHKRTCSAPPHFACLPFESVTDTSPQDQILKAASPLPLFFTIHLIIFLFPLVSSLSYASQHHPLLFSLFLPALLILFFFLLFFSYSSPFSPIGKS